jgi:hypothetical protein
MPEIARFYGIIIRMFMEPISQHNRPHFHAYYQNYVAVVGIDEIELLAGELPTRQQRLTLAWAELHKQELLKDWNLLQNGEPPFKIKPLN